MVVCNWDAFAGGVPAGSTSCSHYCFGGNNQDITQLKRGGIVICLSDGYLASDFVHAMRRYLHEPARHPWADMSIDTPDHWTAMGLLRGEETKGGAEDFNAPIGVIEMWPADPAELLWRRTPDQTQALITAGRSGERTVGTTVPVTYRMPSTFERAVIPHSIPVTGYPRPLATAMFVTGDEHVRRKEERNHRNRVIDRIIRARHDNRSPVKK